MQVALSRPTVGLASKPTLSCHSKELAWLREEMMMPNVGRVWKWIPDNLLTVQTLEVLHEECKPAPKKKPLDGCVHLRGLWIVRTIPCHRKTMKNHEKPWKTKSRSRTVLSSDMWNLDIFDPEALNSFQISGHWRCLCSSQSHPGLLHQVLTRTTSKSTVMIISISMIFLGHRWHPAPASYFKEIKKSRGILND